MTDVLTNPADPIDAVVTWVDGSTESHRRNRARYMAQSCSPLHENAINPHRWHCSNEILYCLQSIKNHAPWVRHVWVVVENDSPDLSALSDDIRCKVNIVCHRDIFREFHAALPTFNSLAIESLIWRIDGLSERFLYFNDDVFLTAPLRPSDVFVGNSPVLRGKWANYSALCARPEPSDDPSMFNHFMQINAARLAGYDASDIFSSAHVVHPLRRSVMSQLFDRHHDAFVDNIGHRFRDISQFLPQGLHNHACIADQIAVLHDPIDHLHIKSGQGVGHTPAKTRALLEGVVNSGVKFLCINDLPQLEALIPDTRVWLRAAIGGFPAVTVER